MRRMSVWYMLVANLLLVCAPPAFGNGPAPGQAGQPGYHENQVLVRFKPGTSHQDAAQIHKTLGSEVIRRMGSLHLVRIPEAKSVEGMVNRYQALPEVDHAEPNVIYTIQK